MKKICLEQKGHPPTRAFGKNYGKTTCPVEGTFQLHRPNQSHREFGYRASKQDTDQWSWGK